jgi:hypothetical protein
MSLPQESLDRDVYEQIEESLEGFLNVSGLDFIDISSELYRVYNYPNGVEVTVYEPLLLNVSLSGGHRLYDLSGTSHYIVPGFVHVYWVAREEEPNFIS